MFLTYTIKLPNSIPNLNTLPKTLIPPATEESNQKNCRQPIRMEYYNAEKNTRELSARVEDSFRL